MMKREPAYFDDRPGFDNGQCGAALLTVLLMVTVMSAVAVAVIDDIRFAIRRTTNVNLAAQAHWYALGAEQYARQLIQDTPEEELERVLVSEDPGEGAAKFDIEGGWIEAAISDGSNCFNLNSVVTENDRGEYVVNRRGAAQYRNLLIGLDFAEGKRDDLTAALIDWIDSDSRPEPRGAEDYGYTDRPLPHRTGNTLLADVSELRAIQGYDAGVVSRLGPYVCTKPAADLTVLNLNSLRTDQAVLLTGLIGPALRPYEAQSLIAARPDGGYASVDAFWEQEQLSHLSVDQETRAQTALSTDTYALNAEVSFHEAFVVVTTLFQKDGQKLTLISRQFGKTL